MQISRQRAPLEPLDSCPDVSAPDARPRHTLLTYLLAYLLPGTGEHTRGCDVVECGGLQGHGLLAGCAEPSPQGHPSIATATATATATALYRPISSGTRTWQHYRRQAALIKPDAYLRKLLTSWAAEGPPLLKVPLPPLYPHSHPLYPCGPPLCPHSPPLCPHPQPSTLTLTLTATLTLTFT